jgi:biotin transport system substrate-specific component
MQTNTSTAALAPSLIASRGATALSEAMVVVLASFVLVAAAKVFVPFFPVPMTLATLAVMAIAATFGMRLGLLTVLAYLGEGLAGLPVFTGTPPAVAGPLYLLGPTGGFLAGYLALAIIVGYAADRGWGRSPMKLGASMLVGDALLFAIGFAWLAGFAHVASGHGIGIAKAWAGGVAPFILGDLLKIVLAAAAVPAAWGLTDAFTRQR